MSELTAQQERAIVEAAWDNTATMFERKYGRWIFFTCNALYRAFSSKTESELWHAAYLFTLDRLEEIRRLESDIAHMQERFADPFENGWGDDEERSEHYESPKYEDGICDWLFNGKNIPADGDIRQFAKESYRTASIIARLQAALAELKRGMTAGG